MKTSLIEIDGAFAEGGGQILRTALALSGATGCAFRITGIRAKRPKPGLMRQHLTCVAAAAAACGAKVEGAEIGATALSFRPGKPKAGEFRFAVGTAGSAVLVLQTVVPVLLHADAPSEIVVEGGTHNPSAPPYDFLERTWVPSLRAMGADVSVTLERHGFAPAGGGRIRATVTPWKTRKAFAAPDASGEPVVDGARGYVSSLPAKVAEVELTELRKRVPALAENACEVVRADAIGPGNLLALTATRGGITTVFSKPGEKHLPAESIAATVADAYARFAKSPACVDEHLADQLLPLLALGVGGGFDTCGVTPHFIANVEVIARFFPDKRVRHERLDRLHYRASLESAPKPIGVPRG